MSFDPRDYPQRPGETLEDYRRREQREDFERSRECADCLVRWAKYGEPRAAVEDVTKCSECSTLICPEHEYDGMCKACFELACAAEDLAAEDLEWPERETDSTRTLGLEPRG